MHAFNDPCGLARAPRIPRYSDVLYLEALIGSDTITTAPPATLGAFRDQGAFE